MALAMLLWFIAALSLMVGGIVMQSRVDIKLTQLHVAKARAEAAADGAIQLALTDMRALEKEDRELLEQGFSSEYVLGGLGVRVTLQPLAGLVDLNMATPELLHLLFSTVDGLSENEALDLAERVVEWRGISAKPPAGSESTKAEKDELNQHSGRFESIEDLLMVPGVDRQVFDAVSEVVYVSQSGQGGVDWKSAPSRVLRAIGGDLSKEDAAEMVASRLQAEGGGSSAPAELDLSFQERKETSNFRVDARVSIGSETFLRRRWVNSRRVGADGLPWRFFRSHAVRSVSGPVGRRDEGAS